PVDTARPPDLSRARIRAQPFRRARDHRFRADTSWPLQGAFPDCEHAPAGMVKRRLDLGVARDVATDLGTPEFLPRGRPAEQRTIVPMPETTMDLDGSTPARQHEIRLSGK